MQYDVYTSSTQFLEDAQERADFTLALVEDALAQLGDGQDEMSVWLLNRLATAGGFSLRPEATTRGLTASEEALERARRVGDPKLIGDALRSRHAALIHAGPEVLAERVLISDELEYLGGAAGPGEFVLERLRDWLSLGEMDRVRELSIAHVAARASDRSTLTRQFITGKRAMLALFEGQFDEAERLASELLSVGTPLDTARVTARAGMVIYVARRERGRLAEFEPGVRVFVARYPYIPAWRCGLALVCAESGKPDDALEILEDFASRAYADLPHDANWMAGIGLLAEVVTTLDARQHAETLYDLLLPFREENVVATADVLCFGAASRVLGNLSATMRRWDDAEAHFEHALAFNTRMRTPPWIAYTQYGYAKMLLGRDDPGDRARARELLDAALATAREIGMTKLQADCEALLATA
jgi:tetratricopeptide (TPR) repeat protein